MFCEPCQSAMVTTLMHSIGIRIYYDERRRKHVEPYNFKVTSTCVECGTMEDVGHIV